MHVCMYTRVYANIKEKWAGDLFNACANFVFA